MPCGTQLQSTSRLVTDLVIVSGYRKPRDEQVSDSKATPRRPARDYQARLLLCAHAPDLHLYPVVFRHRSRLYLASTSMLAGTTGLVPGTGLENSWYGYIPTGLLVGGFIYLMWTELPRFWFGPQTKRTARTLVVRGTQAAFIGALPAMLLAYGEILFGREYPYQNLVESIGSILFGIGIVTLNIGLILEWQRLSRVVDNAAHKALDMMKVSGFALADSRLWIGIDPTQNDYGYSYESDDEFVIVLNTGCVYGSGARGLYQTIIHEMSHVYLFQKKHPSHDEKTLKEIYDPIVKRFPKKWQWRIIRSAIYYSQEVFAEDTTFKVLEGARTAWAKAIIEYLRRRRATQKALAISSKRRMWGNALLVVRNCYYQTEMERCQVPDLTGTAKKAKRKLLSSLPSAASNAFEYFRQMFLGLRDDITVEDYKNTLEDYLSKFIGAR